jgi:hypothetical protein
MTASAGVADWPDTAAEGVVFLRQRERDFPDMEVERALDPVGLAQLAITAGDLSCDLSCLNSFAADRVRENLPRLGLKPIETQSIARDAAIQACALFERAGACLRRRASARALTEHWPHWFSSSEGQNHRPGEEKIGGRRGPRVPAQKA